MHFFSQFGPLNKTKVFFPPYSHYKPDVSNMILNITPTPIKYFCLHQMLHQQNTTSTVIISNLHITKNNLVCAR